MFSFEHSSGGFLCILLYSIYSISIHWQQKKKRGTESWTSNRITKYTSTLPRCSGRFLSTRSRCPTRPVCDRLIKSLKTVEQNSVSSLELWVGCGRLNNPLFGTSENIRCVPPTTSYSLSWFNNSEGEKQGNVWIPVAQNCLLQLTLLRP